MVLHCAIPRGRAASAQNPRQVPDVLLTLSGLQRHNLVPNSSTHIEPSYILLRISANAGTSNGHTNQWKNSQASSQAYFLS